MNNAVMRAAMVRIGFTEMAAQALVDEQGMDSLEEIKLLTDDEIESLCKVIRRPGGMIPAPPGGAAGAANIPNPGVPVNQRAEGHLKLLAFYLRHQARISRTVTVAQVTLEAIRTVRELREFESTYKNPDDLPTINAKDWPKTMEAIDEYLRSVLGERKIPLAYVVRKNDSIPDDDDDVIYPTIQDEMIARAPHYTLAANNAKIPDAIYLVNRGKVWDIISKITREHPCWTYVKPAQKTRDGRMAYNGLYLHYLGPNNVDNMATMAEQKLKDTVYNGEQRRWDFEIRYLLDGIKTDKFDAVKTRIMSDERLRNDFDACVTLYQDYIRQTSKKTTNATVNISELKTGKRKADAIEDRYYTREEYAKLTPEQKKELALSAPSVATSLRSGHPLPVSSLTSAPGKELGIDLQTAKRTFNVTTQRGIRTVLHPTLSRRFRTNDRQLRYRRLPIDCFTDTLISNTASRRNNKYAQIFATPEGWCRAYPMNKKSLAHEGLSLLFQREGVPNTIIMDGAREQTMGLFRKKCREVGTRVKQTEPHTPWSNAAEAAIRELKKGVGRQMVKSGAPKRLWDDCLEREAYIRSHTAHDIYRLNGQVPRQSSAVKPLTYHLCTFQVVRVGTV
ncbi:Reverse transcriptase (RNA-dependent DNA polymerase) [Fragilaria crotonensis]|nr:Reverse transcriptase (RNA-dependent DNA polymerase) [Fragilaria crotonensis]